MSAEDFIIHVFCLIDDLYKGCIKSVTLRRRGFFPKLSDAEVLTIELTGEFLGFDTDKGIWEHFKRHWKDWFPALGTRANFVRQSANLWQIKRLIQVQLAKRLGAFSDGLHLSDGFPIPLCHFKRAYFCRLFKGSANYGYCASKCETYYGFKGNLLINSEGGITDITVTPANIDEREALWDNLDNIQGMIIADKGLVGQDFQMQVVAHTGVNVQTPKRSNMDDRRGDTFNKWLVSTRRLVETVIGQLSERFNMQKIRARDTWHLANRIVRKTLSHTVACFINRENGRKMIQFDGLIVG